MQQRYCGLAVGGGEESVCSSAGRERHGERERESSSSRNQPQQYDEKWSVLFKGEKQVEHRERERERSGTALPLLLLRCKYAGVTAPPSSTSTQFSTMLQCQAAVAPLSVWLYLARYPFGGVYRPDTARRGGAFLPSSVVSSGLPSHSSQLTKRPL